MGIGDIVRMSNELKKGLIENDSAEHVAEFGECDGIVECFIDSEYVDVRWLPSGLKYMYHVETLI